MLATKTLVFAAACAAALVSQSSARPAYSAELPNGEAMGKSLGHTTDDYTAFGTMFVKNGKTWSGVCKETWPGASGVTVGAALGDPCCKWTKGGTPDKTLSAPDAKAAACAASAPAATTAAPAAAAATTTAPAKAATTAPAAAGTTTATPTSASATPKVTPASTTASGGSKASLAPTIPGGQLCE
ncbi:hypothetical protein Gpo141_00012924 [Globisporangium polare]